MASEMAQAGREAARAQAEVARDMAREFGQQGRTYTIPTPLAAPMPMPAMGQMLGGAFTKTLPEYPPKAWAQGDPADSLYRLANEVMNKGDYRRAATLFKEIPVKFQYSAYAADAMYWSAHALYRVGGTPDLQEALQILETMKAKYPSTRLRNGQGDVASLQVRIAGVLSTKGQGGSDIVKRALAANTGVCDTEDAQVRSAALNALMQTDPEAATQYALKVLGKKDECSRDLRRNALFLIGERRGGSGTISAASIATLISVAKTDPSPDVRQTAVSFLGRTRRSKIS
jgi:tetratricopeptide (TPR) repeat protein